MGDPPLAVCSRSRWGYSFFTSAGLRATNSFCFCRIVTSTALSSFAHLAGASGTFPVAALVWQQKLRQPRLEAGLSLPASLQFTRIKEVLQCRAKGFVFSSLPFAFWMRFIFHLFMTKKKGLPHKRIKCMSSVDAIQPYLQTIATQTLW